MEPFKEGFMGLRIKTNVQSLTAQRNLKSNNQRIVSNLEKLSSGYRINKSADDAAGLAISEGLRGQIRSLNQASRNANDGISLIQIAEGSLNEISNIVIRLRELTVQAASDTVGNRDRLYLNKEYRELVDEIDRISNTTEFNGTLLLRQDGETSEELVMQVGIGNGEKENTDTLTINLAAMAMNTELLGLGKGSEIGPLTADESISRTDIANKLNAIDSTLNLIAEQRSSLGANQSRLNSAISNITVIRENLSAANSRIRDVDFASETASLTQNRILTQANISVLAQANQAPEMALNLLR